jgi:ABC-type lipoprotein export system ATPase subunit
MTEPLVEFRNVTRQFSQDTPPALNAITFVIRQGARIALMGPSGSGKSTLLNLIAGLDQPSSGEIDWKDLDGPKGLLPTKIGVMFQSRSLIPWLDVAENVVLPLQIAGQPTGARDRAMAALAEFGLEQLADKLPEELSGGQAQRVSLVRATITNPPLLLADEPTGQLDHSTASHVLSVLLNWAKENRAALLIASHDPFVAEVMGTVWRLDHGQITETTK